MWLLLCCAAAAVVLSMSMATCCNGAKRRRRNAAKRRAAALLGTSTMDKDSTMQSNVKAGGTRGRNNAKGTGPMDDDKTQRTSQRAKQSATQSEEKQRKKGTKESKDTAEVKHKQRTKSSDKPSKECDGAADGTGKRSKSKESKEPPTRSDEPIGDVTKAKSPEGRGGNGVAVAKSTGDKEHCGGAAAPGGPMAESAQGDRANAPATVAQRHKASTPIHSIQVHSEAVSAQTVSEHHDANAAASPPATGHTSKNKDTATLAQGNKAPGAFTTAHSDSDKKRGTSYDTKT